MCVALALTGCALRAEDCYVFGEEEFAALYAEDASRADADALRIMSANVLVHMKDWGGEPVKPRAHRFAQAVLHYRPDVIGMQEMCGDWYRYLLPQLPDYAVVQPKRSWTAENRTPLLYDTQKLRLVDSERIPYTQGDRNGCRVVTAGVFERIADGARFIVTSTHLDLIRMRDYDKEKRIMLDQVSEFMREISALAQRYPDCPIFMTGDYNSMERETSRYAGQESGAAYAPERDATYYKCYGLPCASFAYETLRDAYTDVKFADGVRGICDNTRGYLYDDPTWDHIFMTQAAQARVLAFRVLASDYFHNNADRTSRISDHLPICADIAMTRA